MYRPGSDAHSYEVMERFRFSEGSSGTIAGTVVDHAGEPVATEDLLTATLTLVDCDTVDLTVSPVVGVINGRLAQDVLDLPDVVFDEAGGYVWTLQPEDNIILTSRRQVERHLAQFSVSWSDPTTSPPSVAGTYVRAVEVEVVNLYGHAE